MKPSKPIELNQECRPVESAIPFEAEPIHSVFFIDTTVNVGNFLTIPMYGGSPLEVVTLDFYVGYATRWTRLKFFFLQLLRPSKYKTIQCKGTDINK